MRGLMWVAAVALIATGCSGSEAGGESEASETASPSAMTLAEACPLIEQATPRGLVPSVARVEKYRDELAQFASEGDQETKNAVKFMQDAVEHTLVAEQGSDAADAFDEWTAALDLLANRCNAVGSGAFQG